MTAIGLASGLVAAALLIFRDAIKWKPRGYFVWGVFTGWFVLALLAGIQAPQP